MLKLGRVTKFKMLFLVVVFVFNFDLFKFSAAILEKGLFSSEISQLTIEKSKLSLAISGLVRVHRELSFEISGGIKQ